MATALDSLRVGCDRQEGRDWTVGVDCTVVRAHQHAAGARKRPAVDTPAAQQVQDHLASDAAALTGG